MSQEKGLWFKARRYGWGWTPISWQGWALMAAYILVVVVAGIFLLPAKHDELNLARYTLFLLMFLSATFILTGICFMKGEAPRWQWGDKEVTRESKTK